MTNQERPHDIFLERQNDMIETRQIGPRVKKKKKKGEGHFDDRQHKDKGATDRKRPSVARP